MYLSVICKIMSKLRRKETVVVYMKALFEHLPGETAVYRENRSLNGL